MMMRRDIMIGEEEKEEENLSHPSGPSRCLHLIVSSAEAADPLLMVPAGGVVWAGSFARMLMPQTTRALL